MKYVKPMPILSAVVWAVLFALLGAFTALDGDNRFNAGILIGAGIGAFVGAVFGGYRPAWFRYVFGPEKDKDREPPRLSWPRQRR